MNKIDDDFLGVVKAAVMENIKDVSSESLNNICESISSTAGGEMVYISKSYSKMLSVRNSSIIKEHGAGKSIERLSTKYLLSEKHIRRIVSKT